MNLDNDLAQYKFELDELSKKTVFERDSKENEKIYQLRAILKEILKEYAQQNDTVKMVM